MLVPGSLDLPSFRFDNSQCAITGVSSSTEQRREVMTTLSECGTVIAFALPRLGEFLQLKGNRKLAQSFCKAHARVMAYNHSNLSR
jgi:hypothetical protein